MGWRLRSAVAGVSAEPRCWFHRSCVRVSWLQNPMEARLTTHSTIAPISVLSALALSDPCVL